MFNIIYSEFLKLKRCYIIIAALIAAIFVPVIECIVSLLHDYSGISSALRFTYIKDDKVSTEIICFQFLYMVIFALLAGYIFSREFTDGTANTLYTYPMGRIKIFIGKFITLFIIIFFIYVIQFMASYLMLYIAWGKLPLKDFFMTDIKVTAYSMLLQLLLLPIPIFIGSMTKNVIFPIVYGILGAISSVFFMTTGIYMQMSPLMLPALPIYYFYEGDPIDFVLTGRSAVLTFGISIFLCLYHFHKADIN